MTTERDELARAVYYARRPGGTWDLMTDRQKDSYLRAADRLADAGYRKPREVTTVEELDALPEGALIKTVRGEYREALKLVGGENVWRTMGPARVLRSAELAARHLPATVLHEGNA